MLKIYSITKFSLLNSKNVLTICDQYLIDRVKSFPKYWNPSIQNKITKTEKDRKIYYAQRVGFFELIAERLNLRYNRFKISFDGKSCAKRWSFLRDHYETLRMSDSGNSTNWPHFHRMCFLDSVGNLAKHFKEIAVKNAEASKPQPVVGYGDNSEESTPDSVIFTIQEVECFPGVTVVNDEPMDDSLADVIQNTKPSPSVEPKINEAAFPATTNGTIKHEGSDVEDDVVLIEPDPIEQIEVDDPEEDEATEYVDVIEVVEDDEDEPETEEPPPPPPPKPQISKNIRQYPAPRKRPKERVMKSFRPGHNVVRFEIASKELLDQINELESRYRIMQVSNEKILEENLLIEIENEELLKQNLNIVENELQEFGKYMKYQIEKMPTSRVDAIKEKITRMLHLKTT